MYGVVLSADEGTLEVRDLPSVKPLFKAAVEGGADVRLISVEQLIRRELSVI